MSNKHRKRCLTSLVTRETKTETSVGYHFTPTIMTIITKIDKTKNW